MPQKIRLWEVKDNELPKIVPSTNIGLEKRLHDWLENDISMLDPNLLVIGREVRTKSGGRIDLLCVDKYGDLVAVELKQGATKTDVAAQALDYASWVKDLTADEIEGIAEEYTKIGSLQEALQRFNPPPSTLNERHRSLIVAEDIGPSTERIVGYLSELGVPINVATVQAFKNASGQEMLAQVFLIEPNVAQDRADRVRVLSSKRNLAEMEALADENSLGDLYRKMKSIRRVMTMQPVPYSEQIAYGWRKDNGSSSTAMFIYAVKLDDHGLAFQLHATRCCNHLDIPLENLRTMLPANAVEDTSVRGWKHSSEEEQEGAIGFKGAFRTTEEVETFVAKLTEAAERLDAD